VLLPAGARFQNYKKKTGPLALRPIACCPLPVASSQPRDGDSGINKALQVKGASLTVRNRVPVQCYRDRFDGRALGLGVDLLQGGRRESLAAGNSLVFAVEKLILAAGAGLFSSEGCSGAPNFQLWVLRQNVIFARYQSRFGRAARCGCHEEI
jgi:hypothetical protein